MSALPDELLALLISEETTVEARKDLEHTVALTLQQTAWMQEMARELLKLRALRDEVDAFIVNHNQRSDDPEFDRLCGAYTAATGKQPFE